MVRIGAHDREGDPLAVAEATGAEVVQFFLGDPQGWDPPTFPGGDPAALREALAAAGVAVYIHAPYGINVASANNRIRIPSRKLLAQQLAAAAAIGAQGLIVHGGHVTGGVADEVGYDNWRKAMERIDRPIPLLIENTAGGDHAMARGLTAIARLWDVIGDLSAVRGSGGARDGGPGPGGAGDGGPGPGGAGDSGQATGEIGFCLDTCHAFAGGDDLAAMVDRVKAITGRIDLVHCNNSRDEFGSGRDRHATIETGQIDPAQLLEVVQAAGAPVISETPDPGADIRWLRQHLGAG
jgi:deoxyribonuclease IV